MTLTLSDPWRRGLAFGLLLIVALLAPALAAPATADAVCPYCKAPIEPGAAFCSNCGKKLEAAATPAAMPATAPSVVQVVSAVDTELTSVIFSLIYESNASITSILGSAFAISPTEYVTDTNNLFGAKEVTLRARDGRSYPAKVIGRDRMIGVALLSAEVPGVAPLTVRRDQAARIGESLVAMGYAATAQVSEPIRTGGVISGLNRHGIGLQPIEDFLQTDASLPYGVAGGPLLDARGTVIGMSTGRINRGIGFAVPAPWIGRAVDWIHDGSPQRAWLGALVVTADAENRKRYNLPPEVRLVVEQTFPGSPAGAAGLKPGDGLVSVRGIEATNLAHLHENLLGARVGEAVPVSFMRGAEKKGADITLAARPDNPRLSPLDSLRYYGGAGVEARDNGLVVREVVPDSIVSVRKVRVGDVLQSVMSKKDWEHGARDNSRWRSVHTLADLDERVSTAYSDIDFCLGLRFKDAKGEKHEAWVCDFLSPTGAL